MISVSGMFSIVIAIISVPLLVLMKPSSLRIRGFSDTLKTIWRYRWQWLVFFIMLRLKNLVDYLNNPIRHTLGLNFTGFIYAIEGDAVLKIQQLFENDILTVVLGMNYLGGYILMGFFGILLVSYCDNWRLASRTSLNYFMIYLLAIPLYLFFPVDVTSNYIPEMKPLLYRLSPGFNYFFMGADPLDNCIPSLHIGLPLGLLLSVFAESRRQQPKKIKDYRGFMLFVLVQIVVFSFSILYLGVHWIIDIFAGMAIGVAGAWANDRYADRLFYALDRFERNYIRAGLRKIRWFSKLSPFTANENNAVVPGETGSFFKTLYYGCDCGKCEDGDCGQRE